MSSSQASTDSAKVECTPLGHETNPVFISSSCPVSTSTGAATSFSLAPHRPKITITSPIREVEFEDEGPFIVPIPEAGDLIFLDDEFNLDSIFSEGHEVFSKALPKSSLEKPKTEDASNFKSIDPLENKEDYHPKDASKSLAVDPELILKK
ncbi:hypothetical protein PIB30_096625 [Stylosanthes scabra]|uniref:Uncharacterized protein n=1 Tax=Stylosanthes scabra TaxID=79078 RepID=A0ABU6YTN9_9FABA|nr:hypothetical protein [Stylosanthes scabra]